MADPALNAQHRVEASCGQSLQVRLLFTEVLDNDAPSGAVAAYISYRIEPVAQLPVHVVNILEAARQVEVSTDVAVRPLDLALGFCPVSPAGAGHEAVMRVAGQQLGVVDDALIGIIFAQYSGLHAVVQDLSGHAAEMGKRFHVTAQYRRQVLVQHELSPEISAVPQHHGKQPDFAYRPAVAEVDLELGEVDLCLMPGRSFEPNLEHRCGRRPHGTQEVIEHGLAALVALFTDFPQ